MNVEKRVIGIKNTQKSKISGTTKCGSKNPSGIFSNFPLGNRKGLSPLVATILLVVFALVIGTITMNWGRAYVEKIKEEPEEAGIGVFESAVIISIKDIDNSLKELQVDYITGKITKEEYIEKERALISD